MSHRRHIVAAVLFSTAVALPANASAKPPSDDRAPRELIQLRARLLDTSPEDADARRPEFRPLCDADGYPLVGNLATKVPSSVQPSGFCARVRVAEGRS